jgi:indole-3-glycerol phosphate synthase
MILDDIVAHKREELASGLAKIQPVELRRAAEAAPPARDFAGALRREGEVAVIPEIKRASPSAGVLDADLDVPCRARAYEQAGAAAISVVTDARFFQGQAGWVRQVRDAVGLPVLRKDFVIAPAQVLESRALGADAVLLIAAALDDTDLTALLALTREVGMEALVEVHDEAQAARAVAAGADAIGINNRDLRTFQVDVGITERLVPLIPEGMLIVSESGVESPRDVRRVGAAGADAVLVGTALMRQANPGPLLRSLAGIPKGRRPA